jgi:hypothetical protein
VFRRKVARRLGCGSAVWFSLSADGSQENLRRRNLAASRLELGKSWQADLLFEGGGGSAALQGMRLR